MVFLAENRLYRLKRLPLGYKLYTHLKGDRMNPRKDDYLYGMYLPVVPSYHLSDVGARIDNLQGVPVSWGNQSAFCIFQINLINLCRSSYFTVNGLHSENRWTSVVVRSVDAVIVPKDRERWYLRCCERKSVISSHTLRRQAEGPNLTKEENCRPSHASQLWPRIILNSTGAKVFLCGYSTRTNLKVRLPQVPSINF